jgi:hypothetical protein
MKTKLKPHLRLLHLGVIVLLLSACADVIEKDISSEVPEPISPADSVVEYGTLTFWWTEVEGATHYRLQIVSPSFAAAQRLYLDTLITSSRFDFTPEQGMYHWRVQGVNSAYVSAFSVAKKLEIIAGSNLGRVKVVPEGPANDFTTNLNDILFSWQPISIAEGYRFQIFSTTGVLVDDTTTDDYYEYTLPDGDKKYEWQVTAFNNHSKSVSDKMTLTFDKTNPSPPDLLVPKADSVADLTVPLKFTWTRKSTDVVLDNFTITHENGDAVAGFNATNVTTPTFQLTNTNLAFENGKSYQWAVVSIDKAGNRSTPATRIFKVDTN